MTSRGSGEKREVADGAELTRLAALLAEAVPDAIAIYVFGSFARRDQQPTSDIDLAVLPRRRLDPVSRFDLAARLATAAHRDVDLVDLRSASTVMRVMVLKDALVLRDHDPVARAAFEATALGAYARLNEERRAILDDVRQRAVHRHAD